MVGLVRIPDLARSFMRLYPAENMATEQAPGISAGQEGHDAGSLATPESASSTPASPILVMQGASPSSYAPDREYLTQQT